MVSWHQTIPFLCFSFLRRAVSSVQLRLIPLSLAAKWLQPLRGKLHPNRPSFCFNLSRIYVRIIGVSRTREREKEAGEEAAANWSGLARRSRRLRFNLHFIPRIRSAFGQRSHTHQLFSSPSLRFLRLRVSWFSTELAYISDSSEKYIKYFNQHFLVLSKQFCQLVLQMFRIYSTKYRANYHRALVVTTNSYNVRLYE